jgi:alanine racemase
VRDRANPWRPAWLEIDLDAVAHNVTSLRTHVGSEVRMYFVVKAMGYGHGAAETAAAALGAGVDGLCVVTVEEARALREAGLTCPILLAGGLLPEEAPEIVGLGVKAVVYNEDMAQALSREALQCGRVVDVHLKVDTGMGRFGVPWDSSVGLGMRIRDLRGLKLEGLMTHFAMSDHHDKEFTRLQTRRFRHALDAFDEHGVRFEFVHAANTGAILDLPETHFNMVRPGLAVYGVYPSPYVTRDVVLKPALSLKARVVSLKRLPKGHTVSYGRRYTCGDDEWIGVLPIGYHDGYRRQLGNRGRVLQPSGGALPVVGGVAMDATMVRIEDPAAVGLGQELVLLGTTGTDTIDVHEIADLADTVSYDILCGFSPRLPRVYLREGKVWKVVSTCGTVSFDDSDDGVAADVGQGRGCDGAGGAVGPSGIRNGERATHGVLAGRRDTPGERDSRERA